MLVSLTVGKVDAGVAVLLTEDKRLIEFPSILLPPDIATGSVVDVDVSRNHDAESQAAKAFDDLQAELLSTFGAKEPQTPILRCRNATQTSIVLEWDPIVLATAKLRSLALYRNGAKVGVIPRPLEMTSTKISGLAVDTEYTFQLVLRTSAGTFSSDKLAIKTHKMTDLHGITVTPGIMPAPVRESLNATIEKVGAKIIEQIRIDTTHFVCTEGRGPAFEKAREMNIPVVLPDWVKGCEREGRLVGVRGYYLDANPKDRQVGQKPQSERQQQQQRRPRSMTPDNGKPPARETPTTNVIPPTPERSKHEPEPEEAEAEADGKGEEDAEQSELAERPKAEGQTEASPEGGIAPETEAKASSEAETGADAADVAAEVGDSAAIADGGEQDEQANVAAEVGASAAILDGGEQDEQANVAAEVGDSAAKVHSADDEEQANGITPEPAEEEEGVPEAANGAPAKEGSVSKEGFDEVDL